MMGLYSKFLYSQLFSGQIREKEEYNNISIKKMVSIDPEELETWRQHLLKYCGLDTFAMVKVWEKLNEAANVDFH